MITHYMHGSISWTCPSRSCCLCLPDTSLIGCWTGSIGGGWMAHGWWDFVNGCWRGLIHCLVMWVNGWCVVAGDRWWCCYVLFNWLCLVNLKSCRKWRYGFWKCFFLTLQKILGLAATDFAESPSLYSKFFPHFDVSLEMSIGWYPWLRLCQPLMMCWFITSINKLHVAYVYKLI